MERSCNLSFGFRDCSLEETVLDFRLIIAISCVYLIAAEMIVFGNVISESSNQVLGDDVELYQMFFQ